MLKKLIQVLAIVLLCNMPLIAMEDDLEHSLVEMIFIVGGMVGGAALNGAVANRQIERDLL